MDLFVDASGLITNLENCSISPIHCSEDAVAIDLAAFSGHLVPFSCTYLGILLTLQKPTRTEEQPLIDKVAAKIPTWKAQLLNTVDQTALTKSTLSAIPFHVSIASKLFTWVLR